MFLQDGYNFLSNNFVESDYYYDILQHIHKNDKDGNIIPKVY